jgi:hypothetical protein
VGTGFKDYMTEEETRSIFNEILNRHGFAFQARVLEELKTLRTSRDSAYVFQTIEFPTSVGGTNTRIDFIMSRGLGEGIPDFLLAECKRANPAMANWCFARYPYTRRDAVSTFEPVILETVSWSNNNFNSIGRTGRAIAENPTHIGLEVRTKAKGDASGDKGQAIENACGQVLRALNGFVENLESNRQMCGVYEGATLLPVIFTTADLWICEADLSSADLRTGNVDLSNSGFKKVPWLCYQYHQSPGLVHTLPKLGRSTAITKLMEENHVRTIPIVSPSGMKSFMNWASNF